MGYEFHVAAVGFVQNISVQAVAAMKMNAAVYAGNALYMFGKCHEVMAYKHDRHFGIEFSKQVEKACLAGCVHAARRFVKE